MPVGMKSDELHLSWDFEGGVDTVVWIAGRNSEDTVHGGECQDAFLRRFFREDQSQPCAVAGGLAVRSVVNFKDNVGARLDQLGLTRAENLPRLTRSIADEEVPGERAGVGLFVLLWRRSCEEDSGFLVFEVVRSRLTDIGNDVMDHRAVRGPRLSCLDPFVFGESCGQYHILILDHAGLGNRERM